MIINDTEFTPIKPLAVDDAPVDPALDNIAEDAQLPLCEGIKGRLNAERPAPAEAPAQQPEPEAPAQEDDAVIALTGVQLQYLRHTVEEQLRKIIGPNYTVEMVLELVELIRKLRG